MPELTVRAEPYAGAVAQSLIEGVQADYVTRYGGRDETAVDPAQFAPPGGLFLVAWLGDVPVGATGLRRLADGVGEIKRMYVDPAHRGQGVARRLLAAVEQAARGLGYVRMQLETGMAQPEAMALYESSGYQRIPSYGYYRWSPQNACYAKALVAVSEREVSG
ncbi:GNAT family N-acetyltransferase [soil metagenome]